MQKYWGREEATIEWRHRSQDRLRLYVAEPAWFERMGLWAMEDIDDFYGNVKVSFFGKPKKLVCKKKTPPQAQRSVEMPEYVIVGNLHITRWQKSLKLLRLGDIRKLKASM